MSKTYLYYSEQPVFENEEHHFIQFDNDGNETWNQQNPAVIIEAYELAHYAKTTMHPENEWHQVELNPFNSHYRNGKQFVNLDPAKIHI